MTGKWGSVLLKNKGYNFHSGNLCQFPIDFPV